MMVRLVSEARDEYLVAALHYFEASPRVAAGFVNEIESGLSRIRDNPTRWRIVRADVRRCLIRRFPFGIYYTVEPDGVVVWAIMHLRRKPGYWQERRS